jgi:uncharacterized membrane protein YebE (DUF533 family)
MNQILETATCFHRREEGHNTPAVAALVGAVGAILLGIGAANDTGVLAIAGGVIAGLGFLAASLFEHKNVDWDIFGRLEELEKK